MGNGASGRHRATKTVKRRTRASLIMRFLGRVGATTLALLVFTLIAIQFARVIHQNVALYTRKDFSTRLALAFSRPTTPQAIAGLPWRGLRVN